MRAGSRCDGWKTATWWCGLIQSASYASTELVLRRGERILLATDRVTEAEDSAGVLFGEHLLEAMRHTRSLDDLLKQVTAYQATNAADGSTFQDDCTLLQVHDTGQVAS